MTGEEAALGQPEYERALQQRLLALGLELTGQDLARMDVNVPGVVVGGVGYRR